MNYSVLFIDDDAFMLKALLRTAKRLRPDWHFLLCENPLNWLEVAEQADKIDIIICDYQMPQINGEALLIQAIDCYPAAIRVLLTGDTSEDVVTSACEFSHHIVGKPFTENDLASVFHCVERLQRLPFTPFSREQLGQLRGLPVLPEFVNRLRQLLTAPDADLTLVASLLQHEPALAAKLIQLANSSFMGFTRPIASIHEAVLRLGASLVEAVVSLHTLSNQFTGKVSVSIHNSITSRAFEHAYFAKKLAKYAEISRAEQDMVFCAAIFSAIGQLIAAAQQAESVPEQNPLPVIQSGFLNSTLMSAYLLTLWGHDETLCEILLWQDTPSPENNAVEKLSFILFLTRQALMATSKTDMAKLHDIIESPSLANAFQRLISERADA